ncbi:MAG TPA: hypothetical protein VEO73_04670 [Gemmatimonadales bacterium]|nr:hypothetical protein [Gemmatimonadales bacterium]
MTKFVMFVLATLAIAACHGPPPLVALEAGPPLRLVAAPGVRINARLKPALELDDGTVLRFDSPHVTADSAYFAAAPTVAAPLSSSRHGTLRLSVCTSGQKICRLVEMAVAW